MRRYGVWGGNPSGYKEDVTRCVVEVTPARSWTGFQCEKKRGHGPDGLYCGQHSKMIKDGRNLYVPADRDAKQNS